MDVDTDRTSYVLTGSVDGRDQLGIKKILQNALIILKDESGMVGIILIVPIIKMWDSKSPV